MSCLPEQEPGAWAAVGPGGLIDALAPLQRVHGRHGAATVVEGDARKLERLVAGVGAGPAAILVVEDPAAPSMRARYASPFLATGTGHDVLLGWLRLDSRQLAAYAKRAAALAQRCSEGAQAVALLGPHERRYQELLDELERVCATAPDLKGFRWSAERIRRATLVHALRLGAAAALYTGHGNAAGWHAYGGLHAEHFTAERDWCGQQAIALMFSLACNTGQPLVAPTESIGARGGFSDEMIARGIAGAIMAPLGKPLHDDNRRLANSLLRALASGRRRLRDVLEAARTAGGSLDGYAVMGDPGLCAIAEPGAGQRGATVFAPAPDADLTAAREAIMMQYRVP